RTAHSATAGTEPVPSHSRLGGAVVAGRAEQRPLIARYAWSGFNGRRPKSHDYRNAKTKNACGNWNFELAPKGMLLVAQSCLAAYFISPDHDLKPLMKGAACPVRFIPEPHPQRQRLPVYSPR